MIDSRILEKAPWPLDGREAAVVVAANVGSISHGTHLPPQEGGSDDVDILGAILQPRRLILGLDRWEHWVGMHEELDWSFFSLHKLVRLLVKGNPNVLGLLWMPEHHILATSVPWNRIIAIRDAFVATTVADALSGYAFSQMQQIHRNRYEGFMGQKRRVLVERYGYDIKHAAHLIRLLRMGLEFLEDGQLRVDRTGIDADELRAIKRGEWDLEQVQRTAADLFADVEEATKTSSLPAQPDRQRVDRELVSILSDWVIAGDQT